MQPATLGVVTSGGAVLQMCPRRNVFPDNAKPDPKTYSTSQVFVVLESSCTNYSELCVISLSGLAEAVVAFLFRIPLTALTGMTGTV